MPSACPPSRWQRAADRAQAVRPPDGRGLCADYSRRPLNRRPCTRHARQPFVSRLSILNTNAPKTPLQAVKPSACPPARRVNLSACPLPDDRQAQPCARLVAPCTVRGLWRVRSVGASVRRGLCAVRSCAVRGAFLAVRPSVMPSACPLPISTGKPRNRARRSRPCRPWW